MKMEKTSEKENPLLKRKEYWLSVDHTGKQTPPRYDILPAVDKSLGAKEETIVISKVFSERGKASSNIKVLVYKDKKDLPKEKLARQERKTKKFLEKKQASEEKPSEEAPAAPTGGEKQDAPAEEKKEEPVEKNEETAEKPEEKPSGENKEEVAEEAKPEEKKDDSGENKEKEGEK